MSVDWSIASITTTTTRSSMLVAFLALVVILLLLWLLRARLPKRRALWFRALGLFLLHIFFREVAVRGAHKIPQQGPVLFVVAPHRNLFIDPLAVMSITNRYIHFLCARWTFDQPFFGSFARALEAIPVERAMDIAQKGKGLLTLQGVAVLGNDSTRFESELRADDSLLIAEEQLTVASVQDDSHLTLKKSSERTYVEPIVYSCAPHIDQSLMFANVWKMLSEGHAIALFPEGGSHDQSSLLPFKAGASLMSLGACALHPSLPLTVVPVGLNFFAPSRFRSRVYIDIGEPIKVSSHQVEAYLIGGDTKKQVIQEFTDQILQCLRLVTATGPSYSVLHLLWAIRRLYTPEGVVLSVNEKLELTRRFGQFYELVKDEPSVAELCIRIETYTERLSAMRLTDQQLRSTNTLASQSIWPLLLQRLALVLLLLILGTPGALLALPVVIASKLVSEKKAREAMVDSMGIKLEGNDVIATWKLVVGGALLPVLLIFYPLAAAVWGYCTAQGAVRLALVVSVFELPLIFASVRLGEIGWRTLISIKALLWALVGHDVIEELKEERRILAQETINMIDEAVPRLLRKRSKEGKSSAKSEEDEFKSQHFLHLRSLRKSTG